MPVAALAVGRGDCHLVYRDAGRQPLDIAMGGGLARCGLRDRQWARLLPCRGRAALVRGTDGVHSTDGSCRNCGAIESAAPSTTAGTMRRAGLDLVASFTRRVEPPWLRGHDRLLSLGIYAVTRILAPARVSP